MPLTSDAASAANDVRSLASHPPEAAPRRGRRAPDVAGTPISRRGDLVTIALATWLIGGVFLDGWAHKTQPALETFFTPWHAVFYSGFAAVAGWIGWLAWSRHEPGGSWARALPRGYLPAGAGILLFSVSGLGDMAWHETFGIEQGIAALLSPTHLGLFAGMFLIATAPLRSLWSDQALGRTASLGRLLPAVLSLALTGALCAFMLMELNVFNDRFYSVDLQRFIAESFMGDGFVFDRNIQAGVAGFIVTTVVLFGPLLFLLRRWELPPGAIFAVIGTQVVGMAALSGFEIPVIVALGLIGAAAVEGCALLLRPSPQRLVGVRIFCAVAPAAFWAVYLGGTAIADGGLGWRAEIWGGAVAWSALSLLGLSLAMFAPALPGACIDPSGDRDVISRGGSSERG
ncbi:MAG: hypothetical protein QOK16_1841 [Solirubrobacteraceae bacterium]|nr:hypothetical protein [Solirubrobacteraceae bacterium]